MATLQSEVQQRLAGSAPARETGKKRTPDLGLDRTPRRSHLQAIALQLAIRARYLKETWGGLQPLFSDALTGHPERADPPGPRYDQLTAVGIKLCWAIAAFARQIPFGIGPALYRFSGTRWLVNKLHASMYRRIEAIAMASLPACRDMPLPEWDWEHGDPAEFYERFIRQPHPVVLRGAARDLAASGDWTFDHLLNRFGQEDVLLTTKERDGETGRLDALRSNKVYLHNSEILFRRHPELAEGFPLDQLADLSGLEPTHMQLFVGREGTSTPFHAASNWNWFFNLEGRKAWEIVDPRHGFLLYPAAFAGVPAAMALCGFADDYDQAFFPAFKWCPIYRVTLEPGDVLFNPPWWWHAIRNISPTTVGVASRWMKGGQVGTQLRTVEQDYEISRMRSWLYMAGLESWPNLHAVLRHPSPAINNEITVREKRVRFTDKQRMMATQPLFGMRHRF